MRAVAAAALAGLVVAGCATRSDVTLFNDEDATTAGAVAVLDPATGAETSQISATGSTTRLDGRTVKARPVRKARFFADLLSRVPYKPQVYVVYFQTGSTDLTPESAPILEALRTVLKPDTEVQITGHTDTTGDEAVNDALSYKRASEVRDLLVRAGLPVENSRVTGRGEREPMVKTADEVAEPANRRVEVILR